MILLCGLTPIASAQTRGVDVQVNEAKPNPSLAALTAVLEPGGSVRDMLGWSHVDQYCDLAINPNRSLAIPAQMAELYQNVAASGGQNFVTLGFNNTYCHQASRSGAKTFPDTDALRAEFAAYAVAVAKAVPSLSGIAIWNEFNGTYGGGYKSSVQAWTDYCLLSNTVIAAVRAVNPALPIAIGATVGPDVDTIFKNLFGTYGCTGQSDPTIWLDVHPYFHGAKVAGTKKTDWQVWAQSVKNIRAAHITNRFFASEYGGTAYHRWLAANPGGDYLAEFDRRISPAPDEWAGLMWFELLVDKRNPDGGLFSQKDGSLTPLGLEYQAKYNP